MVKLAADVHEDGAQKVESPPLLRSEGLPVGSPEADTPDKIVRAGFGEELVTGVQYLPAEGRGRQLREVALVNDVIAMSFPWLKLATERPRRFCCAGSEEAYISRRVAVSPKSLAFSDIMYCSAQLLCSLSTAKAEVYHWENTEGQSQNKGIWEEFTVGGSGGEQREWCGPVECGVKWSGESRFGRPWFLRALGEWSMLSRSPGGVRGGVVAVTGNPGGPC